MNLIYNVMKTENNNFKPALMFVLLGCVLLSCREIEPGVDPPEPKSKLPGHLAGNWLESWSLSMAHEFDSLLYNPQTHVWFRGSYDPWSMDPVPGFGIQLRQDGSFIWAVVASTSTGGCQIYTARYLKGEVKSEGDSLIFSTATHQMKYHSVCNPGNNFDRSEDQNSFSLSYALSSTSNNAGQAFEVLTLTAPDGSQTQYMRNKYN